MVNLICQSKIGCFLSTEMQTLHTRVLSKGRRWFGQMPPALRDEIYRTFGQMPEPEVDWWCLDDGPAWLWWLLAILPLSKSLQVTDCPLPTVSFILISFFLSLLLVDDCTTKLNLKMFCMQTVLHCHKM